MTEIVDARQTHGSKVLVSPFNQTGAAQIPKAWANECGGETQRVVIMILSDACLHSG